MGAANALGAGAVYAYMLHVLLTCAVAISPGTVNADAVGFFDECCCRVCC